MNDDQISRQRLLKELKHHKELFCRNRIEFLGLSKNDKARADEIDNCIATVINMPSAQPQRIGHWISVFDEDEDKCSECQATFFCASTRFNFCPNCGADMRGEQ